MDYPSSLEEIRKIADEAMRPVVGGFESVALVGFPDHSNVGDSAIWLGELAYLKSQSVKVAYSCSSASYRKENLKRHTDGDIPILIHGGGYFGDIWRDPFDFMLQIVEGFPDRPIVVMPQTIHFESEAQLERARHVINGHRSMTMCVRDDRSATLAREYFDHPVVLTPDSAVFLDLDSATSGSGVLYLMREDREALIDSPAAVERGIRQMDWVDLPSPGLPGRVYPAVLHRTKAAMHARIGTSDSAAWQETIAASARTGLAHYRLQRGVRLLASAEITVTDRLHAHILSMALDRSNVLLDTKYGKIHAYHETWSRGLANVRWASDVDAVREIVRASSDGVA